MGAIFNPAIASFQWGSFVLGTESFWMNNGEQNSGFCKFEVVLGLFVIFFKY